MASFIDSEHALSHQNGSLTHDARSNQKGNISFSRDQTMGIPHEFPRSHWPTATGQCVKRYLSATMGDIS